MEQTLRTINSIISLVFFLCYAYQFFYIPVPWLKRFKPRASEPHLHCFAVLICARNEESVIADLLQSLESQTYPRSLLTVFVMADNCNDRTAEIARSNGAVVYERQNKLHVGKGYALDALLQNISVDYSDGFDGYFVFDADNVLAPDYIEQMNRCFSEGHEIITSYRNSKNYGDNWISAGYALWFLRESKYLNGARMRLGSSCAVSGTGFLMSRSVIEESGGWRFYLLTEDIEFSIHHILRGRRIAFCENAVLYDEQPTSFRISCRQRMRWAKGYLQVFHRYGKKLIQGVFAGHWSCFDMSMAIMPAIVLTTISLVANLTLAFLGAASGAGLLFAAKSLLEFLGSMYLTLFVIGSITTVSEWRQIRCSAEKKILYSFTFPIFMFTYIPVSFAALFVNVSWKPIPHNVRAKETDLLC